MMESLEALERIYNDAISLNEIEEDVEKIEEDYNIIKQDLEHLKQLEEENQDLKNRLANEQLAFDKLFESNQKLSELYAKLKQVIDILQVKRIQKRFLEESKNVDEYNKWISNLMNIRELTQEEYELLKEILEDES